MKQFISLSIFCGGILFMSSSFGVPSAPTFSVSTEDLAVTVSWTASPDADGYTLFYAPDPYIGEGSIQSIDMGSNLSFSSALWNEASFFVAIKAYDDSGLSPYSNMNSFTISSDSDTETFLLLVAGASGSSDGAALTMEGIDPSILLYGVRYFLCQSVDYPIII